MAVAFRRMLFQRTPQSLLRIPGGGKDLIFFTSLNTYAETISLFLNTLRVVLHRHLPSGLAWCDTPKGERPVSPEVLEKALCDAEMVQLDEPVSPTWEQNNDKETDSSVMKEDAGSNNSNILKEANDYINEQYMKMY